MNKILSAPMRRLSLLLLQGPASPFLREVARAAERRKATIHKINFCIGDLLFWWPRGGDWYRATDDEWPEYLKNYIVQYHITDILMLGDGRPKHAAAIQVAQELGIRVHIFEHGYLRPDWLTLEPFGMSSASRFPTDPQVIRELAQDIAEPSTKRLFDTRFMTYACYDLLFHIPNVALGWLAHPNYRTHGAVHPLLEYAGWIGKALRRKERRSAAQKMESKYLSDNGPEFFLFPLQLPGDYQIKVHAPLGKLFPLVESVINSFARHAQDQTRLLFKTHPLDNGLSRWKSRIEEMAERFDVAGRVDLIDGGDLDKLVHRARGIVTINSTVGLTALLAHKPVIALGAAIYDVEGLTAQTSLAEFWQRPTVPLKDMPETFAKALAATTQFRGGFIGREAIQMGAEELCERLFSQQTWATEDAPVKRSVFRYEAELRAP
ncbi:capsule biosynthesis protein [Agrobacterium sp. ES01]|uniref:capsule biosynthesis protein n=1 Tax=Agrobacterium sp. ES01 TaxID=3420714 RepID=UPI003D10A192